MKEPKFARLMNKLIGGLEDRDCKAEADSLGRILNRRGHWRMTTCKNAEIKHERNYHAKPSVIDEIRWSISEPAIPPWRPKVGEHVIYNLGGTDVDRSAVVIFNSDLLIGEEVKIFIFESGGQWVASISNLRPLKS